MAKNIKQECRGIKMIRKEKPKDFDNYGSKLK